MEQKARAKTRGARARRRTGYSLHCDYNLFMYLYDHVGFVRLLESQRNCEHTHALSHNCMFPAIIFLHAETAEMKGVKHIAMLLLQTNRGLDKQIKSILATDQQTQQTHLFQLPAHASNHPFLSVVILLNHFSKCLDTCLIVNLIRDISEVSVVVSSVFSFSAV